LLKILQHHGKECDASFRTRHSPIAASLLPVDTVAAVDDYVQAGEI
jgi:hypothetical protein